MPPSFGPGGGGDACCQRILFQYESFLFIFRESDQHRPVTGNRVFLAPLIPRPTPRLSFSRERTCSRRPHFSARQRPASPLQRDDEGDKNIFAKRYYLACTRDERRAARLRSPSAKNFFTVAFVRKEKVWFFFQVVYYIRYTNPIGKLS